MCLEYFQPTIIATVKVDVVPFGDMSHPEAEPKRACRGLNKFKGAGRPH